MKEKCHSLDAFLLCRGECFRVGAKNDFESGKRKVPETFQGNEMCSNFLIEKKSVRNIMSRVSTKTHRLARAPPAPFAPVY